MLLDNRMPGMSGIELLERLAGGGTAPPVVFLSGNGDVATGVDAMKLGAVDFLTKPVDGTLLVAAVRKALERHAGEREALARAGGVPGARRAALGARARGPGARDPRPAQQADRRRSRHRRADRQAASRPGDGEDGGPVRAGAGAGVRGAGPLRHPAERLRPGPFRRGPGPCNDGHCADVCRLPRRALARTCTCRSRRCSTADGVRRVQGGRRRGARGGPDAPAAPGPSPTSSASTPCPGSTVSRSSPRSRRRAIGKINKKVLRERNARGTCGAVRLGRIRARRSGCRAARSGRSLARFEFDYEIEALDYESVHRRARIERTPRRVVSTGEDVRFQSVDRVAAAQAKHPVVHRRASRVVVVRPGPLSGATAPQNDRRRCRGRLDLARQGLDPRRHLPFRPGRYPPRFARYSDGASPVQRRNARVNALGCEKPSEKVMSVIDRRGSSM